LPPDTVPPEKKPKHHVAASYAPMPKPPALGTMLRRLFSAPTTAHAYFPANR